MELSPSDKGRIEHQFDSFCKLVLVCEIVTSSYISCPLF